MKIKLSDHFTYSKLLRFVFPSIIMMVFTSIYGVVDGLFVSNFAGKTAFASINLVMPFVMILGGIGCKPNFWLSVVTINEDCDVTPDEIIKELEDNNIESRRAWNPMHNQPIFSEMDFISCKQGESVGNDIFRRGVCLPSGTAMTEEDLERVASVFRGAFENK